MRVSALLIGLIALAPAAAVAGSAQDRQAAQAAPANCPRTTSHVATDKVPYTGRRLQPQKLTELPPATAYMAVYRRIAGCEAPLTMVEYRNPRRR